MLQFTGSSRQPPESWTKGTAGPGEEVLRPGEGHRPLGWRIASLSHVRSPREGEGLTRRRKRPDPRQAPESRGGRELAITWRPGPAPIGCGRASGGARRLRLVPKLQRLHGPGVHVTLCLIPPITESCAAAPVAAAAAARGAPAPPPRFDSYLAVLTCRGVWQV